MDFEIIEEGFLGESEYGEMNIIGRITKHGDFLTKLRPTEYVDEVATQHGFAVWEVLGRPIFDHDEFCFDYIKIEIINRNSRTELMSKIKE